MEDEDIQAVEHEENHYEDGDDPENEDISGEVDEPEEAPSRQDMPETPVAVSRLISMDNDPLTSLRPSR